jgi:hypothetical protein
MVAAAGVLPLTINSLRCDYFRAVWLLGRARRERNHDSDVDSLGARMAG